MIRSVASILLKDKAGIVVVLYSDNQRLWFEKLRRSIEQEVKRLHCTISPTDALYMFPRTKGKNDLECLAPSCGMCCDCPDVSVLHAVTRRLVLQPKVSREGFYDMLKHGWVDVALKAFRSSYCSIVGMHVHTRPLSTLPD